MLIGFCFLLSGAAALVLQVIWVRLLGHVFGASALAVSSTLTAFMGGLAFGAYLMGKRAPNLKNPFLTFALLETVVGIYGLFVPFLLSLLPSIQASIVSSDLLGFWGYSLLRFILVALVLIIPTTAMGATLPALAQGIVRKSDTMATQVGVLYTANTFGAVIGAALGGFFLIPQLGMKTSVYIAASMDLCAAALVFVGVFVRGGEFLLPREKDEIGDVFREFRADLIEYPSRHEARLVVLCFAFSGAAAMALQVLWTRAVGVVIGASTYAFTLILLTFLVGLTGGAAVMTRYVDRIERPVAGFARIQVVIGILAVLGTIFVDKLPFWLHRVALDNDLTTSGLYFANFAIASVVMLPTTLVLGSVMPLVVKILAIQQDMNNSEPFENNEIEAGPLVGKAYTYNTVGAIVGSFAGGFLLLPLVGVQNGLFGSAIISILLGVLLSASSKKKDKFLYAFATAGVCVVLLLPRWDVSSWTSGLFRIYLARSVFADGWEAGGKLIYHRDGISTTVTVEKADGEGGVWLKVNGKVDASDYGDMPTQVLSGLLPILVAPNPEDILIIGYGSGVTPGATLQAPVKSVKLIELESAVLEAADTYFGHVNHQPYKDDRYEAIVDDGRNYLLTHEAEYDVIISEPSNPWMSGASSLFTQDFFHIAKQRLAEDGVFLQWLQLYELSPKNIHAILRTFQSVFPEVVVFSPNPTSNDTLLLGSRKPITFNKQRLTAALADKRFRDELARAEVHEPEDLFGLFVSGGEKLVQRIGHGPLNTDDNAMIEFGAPRDLLEYSQKDARLPFVDQIAGRRIDELPDFFAHFDFNSPSTLARGAERLLRQGRRLDTQSFISRAENSQVETSSTSAASLKRTKAILDWFKGAFDQTVVLDLPETRNSLRYAKVLRRLVNGEEEKALELADFPDGFEKMGPAHRFLYAYLCLLDQRITDAAFLINEVLDNQDFVDSFPEVLYYAAHIYAEKSRPRKAVELMTRFVNVKGVRAMKDTDERELE